MKPKTTGVSRAQNSRSFQREGPNWVLIAGGALLSTLSIRLGYKLKQAIDTKQQNSISNNGLKGNGKFSDRRKSAGCHMHTNVYSFTEDDGNCFNCLSGTGVGMDITRDSQMMTESDGALPLVTVPASEFNKENGVMWASSPDRLELPPKPFNHQSNCSDSPCVSESGSDVFSKREVIHKLRQQLKRRDDMILEMQDQIVELQSSLNAQLARSTHLQSQLDAANRELFDSEREIQRLRKVIADHCVGHSNDKSSTVPIWPSEALNGHASGCTEGESNFELPEKGRGEGERIDMLKREVGELKEVIEGKDYLLQSYKEQKAELSVKIKELQQRLDSQLPNIL
ncbi:intracellular protein transporter [Parasponia andersonii]|uniref:Intracellular protein transporter n=1 Tax=Parasponia andersonii TaxID=3476 RepID=A0A2P5DWE5_PARAD|nr:intracellular protein transporter [Parasponia andersonii]